MTRSHVSGSPGWRFAIGSGGPTCSVVASSGGANSMTTVRLRRTGRLSSAAMRIIVLGGTRFTGPHIVRRLRERGDDVVVVHRGTNCDDLTHMHCDRRDVDIRGDLVIDLCCMTEAEARAAAAHFRNERYVVISSGDVYRNYDGLQRHTAGAPDPTPLAEDAPLRETLYPYRDKAAQLGEWVRDYDKILVERALAGDRTTVLR